MKYIESIILLSILVIFVMVGCAAVGGVIGDIANNTTAFKEAAQNATSVITPAVSMVPGIPIPVAGGIGYALGFLTEFLRRVWANRKKKK